MANDATFLQFDPDASAVIAGTGGHPENTAVMTSYNQGQLWIHEDVVDTSGSFLPPGDQGIASLQVKDLVLSPSNPAIRYAALAGVRCTDDKAHPQHPVYDCSDPDTALDQPPVIVRWFGELSGNTDCDGTNDCEDEDCWDAPPCHIAVFTFEDTDGDDIVSTALYDFFESARVNAADYILFEEVSNGEGWAWCAERADFYRDNYLAYAVDGGSAHSQGIAKWYRNPNTGGSWLGPDSTYYWNYYGEICLGIYSWCSEGHWDEWCLMIIPDRDDAYEAYVAYGNACGLCQTCQLTIRIGPSRAHACGF